MTNCSLITIQLQLPTYKQCGVYFACVACGYSTYVKIEHGADGMLLLGSLDLSNERKLSPPKLCWVRTREGNLLISCGYCRSGKTAMILSPAPAGTSYSPANSSAVGELCWCGHRSECSNCERKRVNAAAEWDGQTLRERIEFFK